MKGFAAALAAASLLIATWTGSASAHVFAPAQLDVTDLGGGRYEVLWQPSPDLNGGDGASALLFPSDCRRGPETRARFMVDCSPEGLGGRTIVVRGLTHGEVLVRFGGSAGPRTEVLRAENPVFHVPEATEAPRGWVARAGGYVGAGVEHILGGPDHLLFVLGLLLLVRGTAAIARTVTAFTLAHSITLALAATAAASLPPAPVEVCIALSLVLLASELARPHDPEDTPTLTRRHPAFLAFAFGLLHGFGFAGGLVDLRVPPADLPLALAGFNLGVEAGQLLFVAAALAAREALPHLIGAPRVRRLQRVPVYLVGCLGAFFVLDRITQLR